MQKVVIHAAGGYERLRLEEHPDPAPGPGEVLVDVTAIGVNFADCVVRMGLYASAQRYVGWPITPGFEVAGRVAALGEGVSDLTLGDEVVALTRFGGYATRVVAPRHQVFARPGPLSLEQAAAVPCVFLTAYYGLVRLAHARAGERVLVHSAAGGVGGALLQLCRVLGCEAVGVVGAAHKVASARAQWVGDGGQVDGAPGLTVIDRAAEPLWEAAARAAPEGYDVVLDATGVATLRQSYQHLRPTGRLVVYGFHSMLSPGRPSWLKLAWSWLRTPRFDPLQMTGDNKSVLAFNLSYLFERADLLRECLDPLLAWFEAGTLQPPPVRTYALAEVAAAQRDLELGATVGKLVLVV
ncbi:MAG: medium chain dehydrogenase/reductase family protein [Planctomycetota bacterium]